MLEHDHIRLRRKLESVLGELNSISADKDPGDVYLERATEIVVEIENEAQECLNSWGNFISSKSGDIECKKDCIKELSKLVDDIEEWFENNTYKFVYNTIYSFMLNAKSDTWSIAFGNDHIVIKNKSGLIQLASLLANPDKQVDLKNLANNIMKPSRLGLVDDRVKNEFLNIDAKSGGLSIEFLKAGGSESNIHDKDITSIFNVIHDKIDELEQSELDYTERHEEIENLLDQFAKYIGKRDISLKEFRGEYFLKNILKENSKKNIRNSNPSIVTAETVEKAMRRCIKVLQKQLPSLGNHLANSIKFRHGVAFYDNVDGKKWKINF